MLQDVRDAQVPREDGREGGGARRVSGATPRRASRPPRPERRRQVHVTAPAGGLRAPLQRAGELCLLLASFELLYELSVDKYRITVHVTCFVLVDIPERAAPRGTRRRLVLGAPQLLPAGGLALGAPLRSRAARVPRANARPRLAHRVPELDVARDGHRGAHREAIRRALRGHEKKGERILATS